MHRSFGVCEATFAVRPSKGPNLCLRLTNAFLSGGILSFCHFVVALDEI